VTRAEGLVKRMELEARMSVADVNERQTWLDRARAHEADLADLRRASDAAACTASTVTRAQMEEASRAELGLGVAGGWDGGRGGAARPVGAGAWAGSSSALDRERDRLEEQGDHLRQGRQQLQQAEEIGLGVLGELHSQRQTMLGIQGGLLDVEDYLGRGRRTLSTMARRAATNKMILWGVTGFLSLGIVLVLASKFS